MKRIVLIVAFLLIMMIPSSIFAILAGDIDNNGSIDLRDAIIALQLFSKINVILTVDTSADVDGDGEIGMAEAIYALQCLTRLRNNHAPVLTSIGNKTVDEGVLLTFNLSATDTDRDILTYSANNLPSGSHIDAKLGAFVWTPSFGQNGSYQVTFVADDSFGGTDSETITITVNNINRAPVLNAIGNRSVDENSLLSFAISATDADGNAITYSASSLPSGASFDPGTRVFSWTPTYAQVGAYQVTFVADDGFGGTDSETITIRMKNTSGPLVFSEKWESATLGTRIPDNVIKADMGEWFIGDTISEDPNLCGPITTSATIAQNTEQNRLLQLTSNHGVGLCAENIWATLGTNIPIVPFTTLSFYEAGSFLSNPQPGVSWCFFPPCNDSMYLALEDNRGNTLYYVMQYPQNFTRVSRPHYGEIYLNSLDDFYSRDIYSDFRVIPEFIVDNASLRSMEFSISTNGNAVIDDIQIRQSTPPPGYSCPPNTCSSFPYVVESSDTYSDPLGDACFTFIDLKDMTVKVDNATVTVTISVADIPSVFQFNQPGVPANYVEYEWAVYFDINDDNAANGDIKMALSHYKNSNYLLEGSLLDNLQKSVWKYTSNTSTTKIGNLTAQLSGNTFTISVDKSSHPDLSAITDSTKVRFSAGYYYPYKGRFYRDTYPDCL